MFIEKLFENWKAVPWSVERSSGVSKGKHDVGHQRLVKVGQQLQHTELEGHRQPCIVWLKKHNHGIDLVIAGKKGQDVIEVLLVLLNASAVPNARGVNKVEHCGVCLNCILLRELGSRLATGENLIVISPKCNVLLLSFFIRENKPAIDKIYAV